MGWIEPSRRAAKPWRSIVWIGVWCFGLVPQEFKLGFDHGIE
ncbi:hypothetical protein ACWDKQ_05135 [Saccharopolyspora sp. NPDC000995]